MGERIFLRICRRDDAGDDNRVYQQTGRRGWEEFPSDGIEHFQWCALAEFHSESFTRLSAEIRTFSPKGF